MKRHIKTFAIISVALTAFACTKGPDECFAGEEVDMTVEASFQEATKAVMDSESCVVEWETGDRISLLHAANNFALTGKSSGAVSEFTGKAVTLPCGENYIAVYPYSPDYQLSGNQFEVNLPGVVRLIPESFSQTLGTGIVADGKVRFSHVTGYIGFEITRDDISNIIISSEGKSLSGKFTATVKSDGTADLDPADEGKGEILINTEMASGVYYIPIPQNKYNGFEITIKSSEGTGSVFIEKYPKITAGKISWLGAIDSDIEWKGGTAPEIKVLRTTSSTVGVSWSVSNFVSPATDLLDNWSVGIYNDASCSDLKVSWDIPSSLFTSPEGSIYSIEGPYSPRFMFSGLEAGKEYYIKAWNTAMPEYASEPLAVTTEASANVMMPESAGAKAGDVILQEDFSELLWGADIGGRFWGYSDNNRMNVTAIHAAEGKNPIGKQTIDGVEHDFYLVQPSIEMGLFNTLSKAVSSTRMKDWASIAEDDSDSKVCVRPGYIKLGASSKEGGLVTPALTALEGKAVVKVYFKAHPYRETSNDLTDIRVMAITAVETGKNSSITDYTVGNSADIAISDKAEWKEYSCELLVEKNERIAIYGLRKGAAGAQSRILIDDVKVEVKEAFSASKIFSIKTPTDLKSFLMFSDEYEADETVVIENDIDLTGYSLFTGGEFKGILDGRGHSLKNWENDGLSLFKSIAGTVSNLVIDATSKVTPAMGTDYGIFAGKLLPKGKITGCENNADITLDTDTHPASRFAAFVGKNDGLIKDCTNNGNITIKTKGREGNVYVGAFAGNANPKNGVEPGAAVNFEDVIGFDGCVNNGEITYHCDSQGQYIFIAGIGNSTTAALKNGSGAVKAENIGPRCNFRNCTNNGHITVTITNGGSMAENAGTGGSGNYSNIGGIAGFVLGGLEDCVNKGNITLNVPTSESKACMSRAAVGGVAGFAWQTMKNCNNYGKVFVKGTFANGGLTNPGAGNCEASSFGGVVGQVGPYDDSTSEVVNCHNHGEAEIYAWMASGNGSASYSGGVAGYSTANMKDCSNKGRLYIESKSAYSYMGGIAGLCNKASSGLTNEGELVFKPRKTATGGQQMTKDCRIGGIMGQFAQSLTGCTNNGQMTVTSEDVDKTAAQLKIGGILGRGDGEFNNNVNNGKIIVNHAAGSMGLTLGGGASWLTGSVRMTRGENNGEIIYNGNVQTSTAYIGGFIGYINSSEGFSGITNNAPITVDHNGNKAGTTRLGGVVGQIDNSEKQVISGIRNTEAGVITTKQLANVCEVGGVFGTATKVLTFDNCSNEGAMTVSAVDQSRTGRICIGGLMGINDMASTFKNCSNSGALNIDTNTGSTSYSYIHGITTASGGNSNLILTGNTNTGNIVLNCNESGHWRVGGINGYGGGGGQNSGNTVKADITIIGITADEHNVGGITGYCARPDYVNCTYEGTITTNGSATTGGYVGGIVGRANNAGVTVKDCRIKAIIKTDAGTTFSGITAGDLNGAGRTISLESVSFVSGCSVNGVALTDKIEDSLIVGARNTFTVKKTGVQFVTE